MEGLWSRVTDQGPHVQLPPPRWATQGSLYCQLHALLGTVIVQENRML